MTPQLRVKKSASTKRQQVRFRCIFVDGPLAGKNTIQDRTFDTLVADLDLMMKDQPEFIGKEAEYKISGSVCTTLVRVQGERRPRPCGCVCYRHHETRIKKPVAVERESGIIIAGPGSVR